ncbi:peptidylprolyl isomerase [Granulosicoccus antarcticus]|uniref:peptidylprolyl isomerase n=1 Tax=Granulosicoccus antarcticus IMCC3135 TaxID=1192854 RepID=A0A2Z2NZF4_9GAMM|nr:peptidylprolyl isomerase [Granulosicoccus antarcticus]ASJ75321.1 putative parvulin-type peptidyl-prolyl cis-trans isomerase [Granulosicoccus antarcticus IMCC3135]
MPTVQTSSSALTIPVLALTALFSLSPVHAQDATQTDAKESTAATSTAATVDSALPEGAAASVNGRPILDMSVDNVTQQVTAGGQQADEARIIEELINLEVLAQEAEKLSLDETAEISAALQLQYTQIMANAYLAKKGSEMIFSEEELQAEYKAQSTGLDRAEYRASHILLETQEDAQRVIDELAAGKTFEELAQAESIDPAGESGGDLGWFQANTMVPEFTAAVAEMEVGDTSKTPVESEFGFHVIKLVDQREAALPDFDSVKTGLKNLAVRKALATHVEELRAASDIKTR